MSLRWQIILGCSGGVVVIIVITIIYCKLSSKRRGERVRNGDDRECDNAGSENRRSWTDNYSDRRRSREESRFGGSHESRSSPGRRSEPSAPPAYEAGHPPTYDEALHHEIKEWAWPCLKLADTSIELILWLKIKRSEAYCFVLFVFLLNNERLVC